MRVGITDEVERRERRDAGLDPHLFEAQHQKNRPQDIGQLRRREENRQRHARHRLLCGEADGEVTDEHFLAMLQALLSSLALGPAADIMMEAS